jgi:hypothetical protein
MKANDRVRTKYDCIILILHGRGALGAYQAGHDARQEK